MILIQSDRETAHRRQPVSTQEPQFLPLTSKIFRPVISSRSANRRRLAVLSVDSEQLRLLWMLKENMTSSNVPP